MVPISPLQRLWVAVGQLAQPPPLPARSQHGSRGVMKALRPSRGGNDKQAESHETMGKKKVLKCSTRLARLVILIVAEWSAVLGFQTALMATPPPRQPHPSRTKPPTHHRHLCAQNMAKPTQPRHKDS
ncbi:hypothetical protein E2C01_027389 [Portunus trituberculatus]|uniref:Uncharacterized protein n=1 Tax=Portunus trituberculatus TaxID=210409 RepID=A0A5B7EL78_PORTR|nr:hypothetical protein [Portunus trituberculatus]